MLTSELVFKVRWIYWILGAVALIGLLSTIHPVLRRWLKDSLHLCHKRADPLAERYFPAILAAGCLLFTIIAFLAKYSQFHAMALNSQDFWLFEDMVRQMLEGAPFLTRFAPQGQGWVQHGAIHAFLSFYIILPLAWIVGPTFACLLFGPMVLGLGGFFLGLVARTTWGALSALIIALSFLASTQVGQIIVYDVHPEAAYPLFVFLWAWGSTVIKKSSVLGWSALIAGAALGLGLKEDAPLVFFPVFAFYTIQAIRDWSKNAPTLRTRQLAAILITWASGLFALKMQFHFFHAWAAGELTPPVWHGQAVVIPAALHGGIRTDSAQALGAVAEKLIASAGGILGAAKQITSFLLSRPWLSLLIFAPWLLKTLRLWTFLFPLAGALALYGGQASGMVNYYSAPLLGGFWLAIALSTCGRTSLKSRAVVWLLMSVMLLGDMGPEFYRPTAIAETIRADFKEVSRFIPESSSGFDGVVAPALLGEAISSGLADRIATERVPPTMAIDFAVLTPNLGRWEMSSSAAKEFAETLKPEAGWTVRRGSRGSVALYVRTPAGTARSGN